MTLPLVDGTPAVVLATLVALLVVAGACVAAGPGAPTARVRRAWRRPGVGVPALLVALGALGLAVVAEDVLCHEEHDWVLRLDREAQDGARSAAASPAIRRAATVVSRLTGEGLVVAVGLAVAGLAWARRRRDALILLAGTLSAWAMSALLKLAFAVPRPRPGRPVHTITGYGFPSAHTFVVVVACGLAAWLVGRRAPAGVRFGLAAAVAVVAAATGAARVLLNAHWLSDVAGGLAVGVLWLGVVMLAVSGREP